ncbi:Microperfuranone synthase [Cladobotryum mycophilum]|uniref:Microperfuranone synthase n=1 Tax=Cladobotryum mycophilum TaxID=491253 RepID=A0ABR0T1M6_9HYPO
MAKITPHLHTLGREAALQEILSIGDKEHMRALAIDQKKLTLVSNIAENFRTSLAAYDPIGTVQNLDVFVADPPPHAASGRADWRENKLGKWEDFSRTKVLFHDCPGIHAKMLDDPHVADFAKIFKAAMKRRGV